MDYSINSLLSRAQYDDSFNCLLWTGAKQSNGYGVAWFKKQHMVHRAMFELTHGPIPKGMVVMHQCDNPACININHLSLGSQHDNMTDRDAKGRCRASFESATKSITKLTHGDIESIANDNRKQREIAIEYNITQQHVSRIKRGWTRQT